MSDADLYVLGIPIDVYVSVTKGECFASRHAVTHERRIVAGARTTIHDLLTLARDIHEVDGMNEETMKRQTYMQHVGLTDVPHVDTLGAPPPEDG